MAWSIALLEDYITWNVIIKYFSQRGYKAPKSPPDKTTYTKGEKRKPMENEKPEEKKKETDTKTEKRKKEKVNNNEQQQQQQQEEMDTSTNLKRRRDSGDSTLSIERQLRKQCCEKR